MVARGSPGSNTRELSSSNWGKGECEGEVGKTGRPTCPSVACSLIPVLALRETFPLSEKRWVEVGPSNSTLLGRGEAGDGVLGESGATEAL